MKQPSILRRRLLLAGGSIALVAFNSCAMTIEPGSPDPLRNDVQRVVSGLENGLRMGGWSALERYFSDDFRNSLSDLEDRFDAYRTQRRAPDCQIRINRILTQDKLVSVNVQWLQRWTDRQGKPQRAEGNSELILRREGNELRIIDVRGGLF